MAFFSLLIANAVHAEEANAHSTFVELVQNE